MEKKIKISELPEFDVTRYLDSEQAIAEYLTVVIEDNDPAFLAAALGDIAKARGMTEVAKKAGITREALYKALRPNASPRFDPTCTRNPSRNSVSARSNPCVAAGPVPQALQKHVPLGRVQLTAIISAS